MCVLTLNDCLQLMKRYTGDDVLMKVLQLYCSSIALNNSISIIFCKTDLMMSFWLHSQEKKIFQYRDSRSDPRFQMIWTNPRVEFQKIFQLGRPVYHIHVRCIFLFLSKLTTTTSFIFWNFSLAAFDSALLVKDSSLTTIFRVSQKTFSSLNTHRHQ